MWIYYFVLLVVIVVLLLKCYLKFTTGWCNSYTCLVGKTAIVTGANTGILYDLFYKTLAENLKFLGIGFATALDFASRGARVILACRNEKSAAEAKQKIMRETDNTNIVVRVIDMASFDSVRKFAKYINETEERLDILVNNAGAGGIGNKKTIDGHVFIMQVNHFSHFLLTHLLLG